MALLDDNDSIRALLQKAKRIAVVGCSPKPDRDSYVIAKYLIDSGYEVIPVNPGQDRILGRKCYPDVVSAPGAIDIVDVFRRPEHVPPIVEGAIRARAGAIWLQLGVGNPEAEKKALDAGLDVVTEKCIKVAHTVLKIKGPGSRGPQSQGRAP